MTRISLHRIARPALPLSALALTLSSAFAAPLASPDGERHELAVGKRRGNTHIASEPACTLENARKRRIAIPFRVSDDGVAAPWLPNKKFIDETTSFAFAKSAQVFPALSQTGAPSDPVGVALAEAGINAEKGAKTMTLDLSFSGASAGISKGELITGGAGPREFSQAAIKAGKTTPITMQPHGGFVAVFK